jgi:hypothetical protein
MQDPTLVAGLYIAAGISAKLPILQGEAPFARLAELQTSGRSHKVQPTMQDQTLVAGF